MLIIGNDDISAIVSSVGINELMDEIIESICEFCLYSIDNSEVHARDGFHYSEPQPGLLEWMPVMILKTLLGIYTDDQILVVEPGRNAEGKESIRKAFEAIAIYFFINRFSILFIIFFFI